MLFLLVWKHERKIRKVEYPKPTETPPPPPKKNPNHNVLKHPSTNQKTFFLARILIATFSWEEVEGGSVREGARECGGLGVGWGGGGSRQSKTTLLFVGANKPPSNYLSFHRLGFLANKQLWRRAFPDHVLVYLLASSWRRLKNKSVNEGGDTEQ